LSRCRSEELVTICEAISNKVYLEDIASLVHEKSDLFCGLGEVVYDVPEPVHHRK
jgi:acetoacetate decarboxylase